MRHIRTKAQFHSRDGERLSRTHHEAHHVDAPDDAPAAPRCLQERVRPTFVHRAAVQDSTMDAADSAALRPGRKRLTAPLMKIGRTETIKAGPELSLYSRGRGNSQNRVWKHLHTPGICAKVWLSKYRPAG